MKRKLLFGAVGGAALTLATTGFAQGQSDTSAEVKCSPLSDDVTGKFITEPDERLVNGSGVECKAGGVMVQTRFQISDYSSRYDCEIRVNGAKPYCFRL